MKSSPWDNPDDWDVLTNVSTEKGVYKLTPRGLEPVELPPAPEPQGDGCGE